jgi:hypothetical protein
MCEIYDTSTIDRLVIKDREKLKEPHILGLLKIVDSEIQRSRVNGVFAYGQNSIEWVLDVDKGINTISIHIK